MKIKGFKELYIHDVPMGSVLNAKNVDSYALKKCNTWISDDGLYMIQKSISGRRYVLYGNTQEGMLKILTKMPFPEGTIDELLDIIKNKLCENLK